MLKATADADPACLPSSLLAVDLGLKIFLSDVKQMLTLANRPTT